MYCYRLNYNNCPHYFKPILELTIFFNDSGIIFDIDVENHKENFKELLNNGQPFIIYGYNEDHTQLELKDDKLIVTYIPENMLNECSQNKLKVNTYPFSLAKSSSVSLTMSSKQDMAAGSKSGMRCLAFVGIPNILLLAIVITSNHFASTSEAKTSKPSFCRRSISSSSAFKCSVLALLSS